jgi:hypothetical protein
MSNLKFYIRSDFEVKPASTKPRRGIFSALLLVPRAITGGAIHVQPYDNPDDGSITDGDDHVWIGNPEVLKGGGEILTFKLTLERAATHLS